MAGEVGSRVRLHADFRAKGLGRLLLPLITRSANNLLPLWQAAQSLSSSETAAAVEIEAVANQIQNTMSPQQVQAIAEMRLTADSLTEMVESDAVTFGQGACGHGQGGGDNGGGCAPSGGPFPGSGLPGGVQTEADRVQVAVFQMVRAAA